MRRSTHAYFTLTFSATLLNPWARHVTWIFLGWSVRNTFPALTMYGAASDKNSRMLSESNELPMSLIESTNRRAIVEWLVSFNCSVVNKKVFPGSSGDKTPNDNIGHKTTNSVCCFVNWNPNLLICYRLLNPFHSRIVANRQVFFPDGWFMRNNLVRQITNQKFTQTWAFKFIERNVSWYERTAQIQSKFRLFSLNFKRIANQLLICIFFWSSNFVFWCRQVLLHYTFLL